jgi:ribose 5-phosphate isomerase A
MVVRLGSGSTAALMVRCLSERISAEALKVTGVATSEATAHLARELGIPLSRLDDVDALDINLDGADEVDLKFQMIKGRGGYAARGNQPKR